jgi:hypothetical protein
MLLLQQRGLCRAPCPYRALCLCPLALLLLLPLSLLVLLLLLRQQQQPDGMPHAKGANLAPGPLLGLHHHLSFAECLP